MNSQVSGQCLYTIQHIKIKQNKTNSSKAIIESMFIVRGVTIVDTIDLSRLLQAR